MKHPILFIALFQYLICVGQADYVILDTEKYIDSLKTIYNVLPEAATSSQLSESEFKLLKTLEQKSIKEYNQRTKQGFKKNGQRNYSRLYKIKKLKKYQIQYIPYLNEQGEKVVWINGFCENFDSDWKKEYIYAFDGGNCFFTIRINLTRKICLSIGTNGYA